jgi:Flp pilus assembly protein TadD
VRHRSIFLPAFAFSVPYFRRNTAWVSALIVVAVSLFYNYPADVRPGLTEVQVAEKQLENGNYEQAFENLRKAEEAGYTGADIHSVMGACIASSGGQFHDAATEFALALEIAPESPTAWKNMAAVLWNYGHRKDALEAAEKAVSLNPALRDELSPILSSAMW